MKDTLLTWDVGTLSAQIEAPNRRPGPGVLSAQSERCLQSGNTRTSIVPQPRLREGLSTPLISNFVFPSLPQRRVELSRNRRFAARKSTFEKRDSVRDQTRFRAANANELSCWSIQGVQTLRKLSVFGLEAAAHRRRWTWHQERWPYPCKVTGQHLRIQCCKDPLRSEVCKWECTFEVAHHRFLPSCGVPAAFSHASRLHRRIILGTALGSRRPLWGLFLRWGASRVSSLVKSRERLVAPRTK